MFHRYVLSLWSAVARFLPFGLNATECTPLLLGSVRAASRLWLATSHR